MKDNINYAEREKQVRENPTLKDAHRMGGTHCAYGWAPNPPGIWSEAHQAEYMCGYREEEDKENP